MSNLFCRAGLAALVLIAGVIALAAPRDALREHMAHMLTGDDEWRTPNPGYRDGADAPTGFGLRMVLSDDGSHATGMLHGIHEDGRMVPYWSLLALYNPVTGRVITQQIGWDGALMYGEVPLQAGQEQTIDTILYGARGNMQMIRHVQRFAGARHESFVYERGDDGDWALSQTWVWRRHALEGAPPRASGKPPPEADDPLVRDAGYLLTGSGRWRADNPDYRDGGDMPRHFGMNYRWGRHGRHIVGEIVSLYADGREEKDWTLFITHNPVTGRSYLEQTGASGIYFRGELGRTDDGRHAQEGLIYFPTGQVKSVRDEVELTAADTRIAHVFERGEDGGWKKVRVWTWRQLPWQGAAPRPPLATPQQAR